VQLENEEKGTGQRMDDTNSEMKQREAWIAPQWRLSKDILGEILLSSGKYL
jgi:hypothetical protein